MATLQSSIANFSRLLESLTISSLALGGIEDSEEINGGDDFMVEKSSSAVMLEKKLTSKIKDVEDKLQ